MADVQPLRALRYDQQRAGPLQELVSPPYDVIDDEQRAALAARSPYNAVGIDLPKADTPGGDPYAAAAELLERWRAEGAVVADDRPALWALTQDYRAPDGRTLTRHGFLARVRVEEYGPGRVRPHERTHPGPKEDRLKLTRATHANLSPIFALHSDPAGAAWNALQTGIDGAPPWGEVTDDEGTLHRLWRVEDPATTQAVQEALAPAELLIADGHHRYETARVYAEEVGGEGPHRYLLACLVALEDPGLTVFPTHRLVRGLRPDQHETLAQAIRRDFEIEEVSRDALVPGEDGAGSALELGYIDAHFRRPFRLRLREQRIADEALAGHAAPYRQLDTAVLEALLLKGALGMTDDSIAHLDGLGYARDAAQALALVESGEFDAAFLLRSAPVAQIREVAAAGENMPPKSTYFFPKVLTGLVFNPLDDM
jgi:uncharacterized protein (DUF1015 family)